MLLKSEHHANKMQSAHCRTGTYVVFRPMHIVTVTSFLSITSWSSWVVPVGAQQIQDGGRQPF